MPGRRKLFEDLGLLDEVPEEQNPYETLGIDQNFAQNLLREDPDGASLQMVTNGMFRVLSRIYHTDVETTGDADRFRQIETARSLIETATPSRLGRWAKTERVVSSFRLDTLREESNAKVGKAAELVRLNMELGHEPEHFSQMRWNQGVLVHHNGSTLLMQLQREGVNVNRGHRIATEAGGVISPAVSNYHEFMQRHRLFGLEPGIAIATYIDTAGRASILNSDLSFIMDVSGPVQARRAISPKAEDPASSIWVRSDSPVLVTGRVPQKNDRDGAAPDAQIVLFSAEAHTRSNTWSLSAEISGSAHNSDFFRRLRHRNTIGATAIGGARDPQMSHFNMIATSTQEMMEFDAGYTPLVLPGNSLVMYDPMNHMPIITDARVMGMIGNGARTA